MEKIYDLVVFIAPLIAGFVTSVIIPFLIKRFAMKKFTDKIEEVNNGKEFEVINKKLDSIENEILIMRGKKK